ncbi:MAG: hypothetical protein ACPHO8_08655 [Mariniblastus sp.]
MSENPFEAQTTMQGGQIPPVGVKSAPSGVQFNLTVCLILSILGLLGACFGGLGLAMAEVQYQAMQNLDSPEAVEVPLVTSDDSGFSIEMGESSEQGATADGGQVSFETQFQEVGRNPISRISNVISLLLGLVTSIVLMLASISGMRRKSGAPKAMSLALALAIFYKLLTVVLTILTCYITFGEMNDLIPPEAADPAVVAQQIASWLIIGGAVIGIGLSALMAGYYFYVRSVFKRTDVLAYFDSK